MKKAFITGITGQDGSYLAELLLSKGYEVHGLVRPQVFEQTADSLGRIHAIRADITLRPGALEIYESVLEIVKSIQPDECYHLAAVQAPRERSVAHTQEMFAVNINGTFHLLTALRAVAPQCRMYFAGSSEMFGTAEEAPQRETTPFHPRSPYGISKVAGFDLTRHYREEYSMFACSGILYNHESERRGLQFVTRKITNAVAKIKYGLQDNLALGSLDARRDWGYAPEYVEAMWLMLQQERPDDFVIATGTTHSVEEFVAAAFGEVGLDWRQYVTINEQLARGSESTPLVGDAAKARSVLGWQPQTDFAALIKKMVRHDLELLKKTHVS